MRVTLMEPERDLLRTLPEELGGVYEAADDDPARARLFPRAYLDPTAEDAEQEWRALVHPDLVQGRLDALARVRASLEAAEGGGGRVEVELEPEDVQAWLGVLNDSRLTLGTRLGVTEDTDLADLDPEDPTSAGFVAYAWLTSLEGELVEALLDDLPG